MKMRAIKLHPCIGIIFALLSLAAHSSAETVRLYFDPAAPQIAFAAGDIKDALEFQGHTVQTNNLSELTNDNLGRKIILAVSNNAGVISNLLAQGGSPVGSLGEQAYALRTTTNSFLNYWVIGGDANGTMYGALQIAEYITFSGLNQSSYNEQDSPHMMKRGIKFNIPFDRRAPTYFNQNDGTSHKEAINHVWDMSFWMTWFDEMARHRYNVLSLWCNNPFPSMLNMPGYPDATIMDGVQGYDENGALIYVNTMTIDEKIAFWKAVMKYGKERGFSTYMCTWNIVLGYAKGKHGLSESLSDQDTINYVYAGMKQFLETYTDLAGFGITPGEQMSGSAENKENYVWKTYGKAMLDYASDHPQRELEFIHRQHDADVATVLTYFQPLVDLPNVDFNMSFKYSQARAHAAPDPSYWDWKNMEEHLGPAGVKSWLTIRNDDWYFLHWADPKFVRDYITNMPSLEDYVEGIYIGADGWTFTREFASKDPYYAGALSIQKTWFMQKIWGRISFNPSVSDDLFKNHLAYRYPEASAEQLFQAWSSASRSVLLANEQVAGTWDLDRDWWPEGWTGDSWDNIGRFLTLNDLSSVTPMSGSDLASFTDTANNNTGNNVSAWDTADEVESLANTALLILRTIDEGANTELGLNVKDLKAMSYLGLYNACKFRALLYKKQGNTSEAREAIGAAYCNWKKYTSLMDGLYTGATMQRNHHFDTWHDHDADALQEYTDLGGIGEPICEVTYPFIQITSPSDRSLVEIPEGHNEVVVPVTVIADAGDQSIVRVELRKDGVLVDTDYTAPYAFQLSFNVGEYVLNARVIDDQGAFETDTVSLTILEPGSFNEMPWLETFTLSDGTKSHGVPTSWTATRSSGLFQVSGNRFMINGGSNEGVFETALIKIPGGSVKASLEVQSAGALNTGDYVRFYKIVDGGTKVLLGQQIDDFTGTNTMVGTNIVGNNVKLRIEASVSASDEYYFMDNLKVEYEAQPTTYSLGTSTANGIIVVSPPGGVYTENTMVEVTAVPNLGYAFGSWGGDLSGSANPTTITMNGNKNVTASFNPGTTYTLVTNATNGSVSLNPPGGVYSPGTQVTLTPNPANGYTFGSWSGDLNGSASPVVITMNGNRTVTANFTELPQVGQNVLLVHGQTTLNASDEAIRARLVSLGHTVTTIDQNTAVTGDANGKGLVVISSTVSAGTINTKFRDVTVPVINWETALQDDFGFTTQANQGTSGTHSSLTIENANHPLAAGLAAGTQTIANTPGNFAFGIPGGNPIMIARINGSSSQACIYAYEKDAPMEVGTAPARRVNLFLQNDTYVTLNANGLALFDAAVTWAIGPGTPVSYPLTTTASHGSISLNPPGGLYESGTTVGVSVTPSLGYRFVGWSGDLTGSSTSTSITMNSAKSIGADFIRVHTLASTATNGSIVLDPPGGTYDEGSAVTATAVPAQGFRFTQWSGLPQGEGATTTITMSDDVSISPIFELIIPSLTCQWNDPDVIIKWPLESSPAWRLEWAEVLDSPSTWTELVAPYQSDATDWFWKGPRAGDKHFFRLRHP